MNTFRKNDGFTLMELLVTIVTASIVTLAATTILLLGLRINRQSMDTATRQTTTRILLTSLEKLATEGTVDDVRYGPGTWEIVDKADTVGEQDKVIISYSDDTKTVYTGALPTQTNEGSPLMENLVSAIVELNENLLTFTIETEEGLHSSSIYCRTVISSSGDTGSGDAEDNVDNEQDEIDDITEGNSESPRIKFLKKLASQYSVNVTLNGEEEKIRNTGWIVDENGNKTDAYYSQWYLGGNYSNGWGPQTPWCACFISWGLITSDAAGFGTDHPRGFANVDAFMNYLKGNNPEGHAWEKSEAYVEEGVTPYKPREGDLIFFDWTINGVKNPEHIGAVITVEGGYVYTIEGNSAGRVAVRKYGLNDPRIIGYGVLNWTNSNP